MNEKLQDGKNIDYPMPWGRKYRDDTNPAEETILGP
jgi:hypothetical protein